MSKRYELVRDIETPVFCISRGSRFEQGVGMEGTDAAYVCANYTLHPSFVEDNPEWFKPIEDKEPTAFQWKAGFMDEVIKTISAHFQNPDKGHMTDIAEDILWLIEEKINPTSQSIPAGKGTANETINEQRIGEAEGGGYASSRPFNMGIKTGNPVLDRRLEEIEPKLAHKYTEEDLGKAYKAGEKRWYNTYTEYKKLNNI
jgi:hypothetical protein